MKKTKLSFVPKAAKKIHKYIDEFSINEVVEFLNLYLADKIKILPNDVLKKTPKKSNTVRKTPEKKPRTLEDILIESVALAGKRAIFKYCKNEKPYPERIERLKRATQIASKLEEHGILPKYIEDYFILNNYLFYCRIYEIDNFGNIIIPRCRAVQVAKVGNCGNDNFKKLEINSVKQMPELISNEKITVSKKQAHQYIMEYVSYP